MVSRNVMTIGLVMLFSGLGDFAGAATQSTLRGPVRPTLDAAHPNVQNWVQESGSVCINFTNYGYFGNRGPAQLIPMNDPCYDLWAPQTEFPKGSGQQYLYQAGLWIGAEVVEAGSSHFRVSVGTDGWQSPSINEFFPGEDANSGVIRRSNLPGAADCFGDPIYDPDARANYETIAVYSDTLVDDFWNEEDLVDGEHEPLGLEITQSTLSWLSPEYSDLVILEYKIRNIGDQFLRNLYLGLYADADCGHWNQPEHHTDDITGFLRTDPTTGDTLNIGWAADNDGRPPQAASGLLETPHCVGVMALEGPTSSMRASYNWWSSNADESIDYGPAWADYAEEDSLGMGWTLRYGTPLGDLHKYQLLSNAEQDFDVAYVADMDWISAHPQHSYDPVCDRELNEPWSLLDPSSQVNDLADGYDTRFMMSWGPIGAFDYEEPNGCNVYRLNPGEEFTFTFAYLLGPWFHDPEHPQPSNTQLNPTLFHFDGLVASANAAKYLFEHHYQNIPAVAVPENFAPVAAADSAIPLQWSPPSVGAIDHYELWGVNSQTNADTIPMTSGPISDTSFTITGLVNGDDWTLFIRTVDADNHRSFFADTLVRVGAVLPVAHLQASVEDGAVYLTWDASGDPALTEYTIARRSELGDSSVFSATANFWTDYSTVSGRGYSYWILTESSYGVTGFPSDSVYIRPFIPQDRILIIEESRPFAPSDELLGGIHPDSVRASYDALMNSLGYEFDLFVQDRREPLDFDLETLSRYDLVLWHSEGNYRITLQSNISARERMFKEYISSGGRMIRAGRNVMYKDLGLYESSVLYENQLYPLIADSILVGNPNYSPHPGNFTFAGAASLDPRFPDVDLDSARVRQQLHIHDTLEYVYDVELIWPHAPSRPLYQVELAPEDTTSYAGQPCAAAAYRMILFLFPLYFLDQEDASQLLHVSISGLRNGWFDEPPEREVIIPVSITLAQNYPNPFNPSTTISFALPVEEHVILKVYNIMGREVTTLLDRTLTAGSHDVVFDASTLPSGIYFYRLQAGHDMLTKKMVLLK